MAADNSYVKLIDPNNLNNSLNSNTVTPKYQNMHIFAELTAQGKDRSVLYTGEMSTVDNLVTTMGSKTKVNFMGANSNSDFTTNWHNINSLESFGISSIKTTVNASMVPQVEIKFVDIRGQSFFNKADSPYRILFDFPPPIFNLTIKGLYGKALTYQLHLVKYTSEFQSESGNFVIDAEFVAMTFAPLTDVLFRYSTQFALMPKDAKIDADKTTTPLNTLDLIERAKSLYSALPNLTKGKTKDIDELMQGQKTINDNLSFLMTSYKDINNEYLKDVGVANLYTYDKATNRMSVIKEVGTRINVIYIGYEVGAQPDPSIFITNPIDYTYKWYLALSNYRDFLAKKLSNYNTPIPTPAYIDAPRIITYPQPEQPLNSTFIYIDISGIYFALIRAKESNSTTLVSKKNELRDLINTTTHSKLGMMPTIYNVFDILLKDVDVFFDTLRTCAKKAQKHHETYKPSLLSHVYEKKDAPIYPFPLIYDQISKTRISPVNLNRTLPSGDGQFPELKFTLDFIETFKKLKTYERQLQGKGVIEANGNSLWIPFTPADAIDLNNGTTKDCPYSDSDINNMYKTLLNRFYVLSQNSLSNTEAINGKFMSYFGEAEAVNIANFIVNVNNIDKITAVVNKYNSADTFFNFLTTTEYEKDFSKLYNNGVEHYINLGGYEAYLNRDDSSFVGFSTYPTITERVASADTVYDPIAKFIDNITGFFTRKTFPVSIKFTSQNTFLFDDDKDKSPNSTKFIYFSSSNLPSYTNKSINYSDFYSVWIHNLSFWDSILMADPIHNDKILNLILYFSNFGQTLSMFNPILNQIFTSSAVIQTPKFFMLYIGGLIYLLNDPAKKTTLQNFLAQGKNGDAQISGAQEQNLLFKDIDYCDKYLSAKDKENFLNIFTTFVATPFADELKNKVEYIITHRPVDADKNTYYTNNITSTTQYINELIVRECLVCYNSISFKMEDKSSDLAKYGSYSHIVSINIKARAFFDAFLTKLNNLLPDSKNKQTKEAEEFEKFANSDNIIAETYYSFKNINDRWLCGMENSDGKGYPFNFKGKRLIDMFAFVDRTMNPIGNTVISIEPLLNFKDNNDASIFTVLTTLLSANHFEFFPIQNFMTLSDDEWQNECFGIDISAIKNTSPAFVCMYIGGTSNYLSANDNYFEDGDGILDITKDKPFYDMHQDTDQKGKSIFTGWGQVKAFSVKFGTQNQSMFTGIKIDSKEYPETNESLQILAKIAGDNTVQAPVAVGQNLFNLYENRAYKATVMSLGNAMIQPMQYFQLENIPIFNGVYIILGVEHNISDNNMTTQFNGVKILKYPVPRILDAYTLFGYTGDNLDSNESTIALSVTKQSVAFNDSTSYRSLYTYNIEKNTTKISASGKAYIATRVQDSISYDKLFTYTDPNTQITMKATIAGITASNAAESLYDWYNKYSVMYSLDPNIIAAQGDQESAHYRFAAFNTNENGGINAMGISQIVASTLLNILYNEGVGNVQPQITEQERNAIFLGISFPRELSNDNKKIMLQNAVNNPEIMIKAQCIYMRYQANRCSSGSDSLLSSTLMAYYMPASAAKNYYTSIYNANNHKNSDKAKKYVAFIFNILDKNFFKEDKTKLALYDKSTDDPTTPKKS